VNRLVNKFEYPDQLGGGTPVAGGGIGGMATITIAASNASEFSKSKADFVCSGTDDHQVIQAAFDLLDSGTGGLFIGGGTVWLSEGNFFCDFGVLRLSDVTASSPLQLRGLGRGTILEMSGGTGSAIEVNATDCAVADLTIDGNDINGVTGINMTALGGRCLISGVKITRLGTGDAAIRLGLGDDNMITNCQILDNLCTGILMSGTSVRNQIIGNDIRLGAVAGIEVSGNNIEIVGNHISTGGDAIIGASSGFGPVIVADNTIEFTSDGVNASGDKWMIIGNSFDGGIGWSVQSAGDANWVVANNTFRQSLGINMIDPQLRTSIIGNFFEDGQIVFNGDATGCQVSGNVFEQATINTVEGAVAFDGTATDCVVSDNLIRSPGGTEGVRMVGGLNSRVVDNLIGAGADIGILMSGAQRCVVSGNTVEFAGEHGIALVDSSLNLIEGNLIFDPSQNTDNTFDGINLAGDSDDNDIWGNKVIGSVSAPQPRYGVNISAATCDTNSYLGNRTGPGTDYGTAAYNDAGTGTINVWAGTAGDNY